MLGTSTQASVLRILSILTVLFILAQILFLSITIYVDGMPDIVRHAISSKLFFTRAGIGPLIQLFFAQILVYLIYIYVLWYVCLTVSELFTLGLTTTYVLTVGIWLNSVIAILALNTFFSSHSIFSVIIHKYLLADTLSDYQLKWTLIITLSLMLFAVFTAFISMCVNIWTKRHPVRDGFMLIFIFILLFLTKASLFTIHKKIHSFVTEKPNIILVSFDALHPDFLGFKSIEKAFKAAGYETIYATDDRRFNNLDERYRFDHIVGPRGTFADYFIGTFNDFPLSNLIVPTPVGRILFPYNYANHASAHTYVPANFLKQINRILKQSRDKPLFLAVQFNITGSPFYWFNDKLPYDADQVHAYKNAVAQSNRVLKRFMALLKKNKCLGNAVVVLLSDDGISPKTYGKGGKVLDRKQSSSAFAIRDYRIDVGTPYQISGLPN